MEKFIFVRIKKNLDVSGMTGYTVQKIGKCETYNIKTNVRNYRVRTYPKDLKNLNIMLLYQKKLFGGITGITNI